MGKYDMRVVKMKLKDCIRPDYNPRKITDNEFQQLKHSIKTFGYNDPIIVNQRNNHIVAGNQRHRALTELNRENHGKYTIIDVVLVDLAPADEKAFNIGHNEIGGSFDGEKLEELLKELDDVDYDITLTGFEDIVDVDMDEFLDDEDDDDPQGQLVMNGEVEYVLTVKCADSSQQDFLFRELREKGYRVKATQY